MGTLTDHAAVIKAAIKAAEDDGFKLEVDITYDSWDPGHVSRIEVDLWGEGANYINVFTEERGR